jgi:hypothetical protein
VGAGQLGPQTRSGYFYVGYRVLRIIERFFQDSNKKTIDLARFRLPIKEVAGNNKTLNHKGAIDKPNIPAIMDLNRDFSANSLLASTVLLHLVSDSLTASCTGGTMSTNIAPQVFLAYAREDSEKVKIIHDQLKRRGFNPTFDTEGFPLDQDLTQETLRVLEDFELIIAFFSTFSVSEQGIVERQFNIDVEEFLTKMPSNKAFVFPVRLDDCKMPEMLLERKLHYLDAFKEGEFDKLLKAIVSQIPNKPKRIFRDNPEFLQTKDVHLLLKKRGFFEGSWNASGKGISHQYELQSNDKVVFDYASGLMWQRSGLSSSTSYYVAQNYIMDINGQRFAGYDDWRLPTFDEAMSLVEPVETKGLHIDPIFDRNPVHIWTSDTHVIGGWEVEFDYGMCEHTAHYLDSSGVRAVRYSIII